MFGFELFGGRRCLGQLLGRADGSRPRLLVNCSAVVCYLTS